jgi:hypothetical protein
VKRRPYVLSLSGPGARLRLELDRTSFTYAMAWVGGLFGGEPPRDDDDDDDDEDLSLEEAHALDHEHAPVALREMLKGLCPELLEDAEQAIAEEKRRRIEAS